MTFSLSAVRAPSRPTRRFTALSTFFAIWNERRALANLDETRLRDLGITANDAACEANRPFWDIPSARRV